MIRFVLYISIAGVLLSSCTKTVGSKVVPTGNADTIRPVMHPCSIGTNITYSNTVRGILMSNCMPCHQHPGDGGIDLDSYPMSASIGNNGELLDVVIPNPNNIMMPPPPQRLLDSCEIKALKLWVKNGCPEK